MRISDWSSDVCSSDLEKYADDPGRWIAWINPTDETPVSGEFCAHRRAPGGIARPQFRPVAVARETEIEGRAVDQRRLGAKGEMAGDDVGPGALRMIHQQSGAQRAVDDQPRIALEVPGIGAAGMDAVGATGEGAE